MKTTLIAILLLAFIGTGEADEQSRDYARFEHWLKRVQEAAPRYGLRLNPHDEGEEEWFYLYYWQSENRSIERAIRETKRAWQ